MCLHPRVTDFGVCVQCDHLPSVCLRNPPGWQEFLFLSFHFYFFIFAIQSLIPF